MSIKGTNREDLKFFDSPQSRELNESTLKTLCFLSLSELNELSQEELLEIKKAVELYLNSLDIQKISTQSLQEYIGLQDRILEIVWCKTRELSVPTRDDTQLNSFDIPVAWVKNSTMKVVRGNNLEGEDVPQDFQRAVDLRTISLGGTDTILPKRHYSKADEWGTFVRDFSQSDEVSEKDLPKDWQTYLHAKGFSKKPKIAEKLLEEVFKK